MSQKSRRIPKYVERAMLRLTDDPEMVRMVGRLMPYTTGEVGTRLYNAHQENIAASRAARAARDRRKAVHHDTEGWRDPS